MYDIIGWVGYVITSYTTSGSDGVINGSFTRYVVDGVPSEHGGVAGLRAWASTRSS